MSDDTLPHGSPSSYCNRGCRCRECRDAWADYCYRLLQVRRTRVMPASVEHGKPSTYTNWSCRCTECRRAQNEYKRSAYWRRKQERA
jgi:hypothetical protein